MALQLKPIQPAERAFPFNPFILLFRAKINNKSELGLGYQQKLRDGVTLTLSSLVNTGTFSAVSTKVTTAFEGYILVET